MGTGVLCSLQTLNHDNPTLPIRLSNRPTNSLDFIKPFLKFQANLLPDGPVGTSRAITARLGFLVFLRLVSLTRHPKQIIGGFLHFSGIRQAHLRANPRHVSPNFPRLFSNATISLSGGHRTVASKHFPIAAKTPTLAVTLISCMKLMDVFRLHNLLWPNTGLGFFSAELHMPAQTKMSEMPSRCFHESPPRWSSLIALTDNPS